jgi:hypothetical protein
MIKKFSSCVKICFNVREEIHEILLIRIALLTY